MDHILAVVVRYFGGIKLGAGGLVRAYTNSVCEALNKVNIVELTKGFKIEIEFKYENLKQIDFLLKDECIIEKKFNNTIIYIFNAKDLDNINKIKNNIIQHKILSEIYISIKK